MDARFPPASTRPPTKNHQDTTGASWQVRAARWASRFAREQDGQDVVEYSILLAVVVLVVAAGVGALSQAQRAYFTGPLEEMVDPPRLHFTTHPANPTTSQSANFSFTSNYAVNSYRCRLDGAAWATCTSPVAFTGLGEGTHTFKVEAIEVAEYTWIIDRTPPVTNHTLSGTLGAGTTYRSSVQVTLTGTDVHSWVSTIYYALNDPTCAPAAAGNCTAVSSSTTTLTVSADGTHALYYFSKDAAGNLEAQKSVTFTVDTTPPDTAFTGSLPSDPSGSASATFSFSGTEAGSTFECSLDGAAFAPCTRPKNLTGLGDGGHTFQVRAVDAGANVDPTPASHTWTIDTAPPDTAFSGTLPPSLTNSPSAGFSFTSTEAGSTFECSLDGTAFTSCTSPRSFTGLSDGSHTFQVRAVDAAGNADATPASHTWTVDQTAPTAASDLQALTGAAAGSIDLTWTAATDTTSGVSGYTVRVVGHPVSGCPDATPENYPGSVTIGADISATIEGLTSGTEYCFYLTTQDQSGNTSSPSNVAFAPAN